MEDTLHRSAAMGKALFRFRKEKKKREGGQEQNFGKGNTVWGEDASSV